MNKKNITNAAWIIGCKIVQSLLGITISMLTARYLGPANFGLINYAAAIVAFVSPIVTLGLPNVIVQEIVYYPMEEGKILGSSLIMSLVSGFICILGVISFAFITTPDDLEAIFVCGLYSLLLISKALELIQYWFQAKLISKYVGIISVLAYVMISAYRAVLLITKQSVYWFAISNAIDHLIIGIALLIIYKQKSECKLSFSLQWVKKLINKSKFFIISSMMVTVFVQTDKIMLKFMIGDEATGIYSAASTCASMLSFVFVAIIDSMRPTILECKKKASDYYETNMCRLYSIIIYMALAQSLIMTIFAKQIICIMYGSAYMYANPVLMIIVWQTTFSYIGSVRNIWILAEGKQRYLWMINLSGASVNVVLNIFFINLWGIEGAAWASVVTQFFTNVIIEYIITPISHNNLLILKSLNLKWLIGAVKFVVKRKSL